MLTPRAGVAIDDDGFMYTTGLALSTLAKYDRDSALLQEFDLMPGGNPQQFQLLDFAVDADGCLSCSADRSSPGEIQ